jgi:hypothetical protein
MQDDCVIALQLVLIGMRTFFEVRIAVTHTN